MEDSRSDDVWLWPENDGVRVWTRDDTLFFPRLSARATPETLLSANRDAGGETRVEAVIEPREAGEALARFFERGRRTGVVHLCDGASEKHQTLSVQLLPFEWLSLNGRLLGPELVFCRHVMADPEPAPPVPLGRVLLADLWPRTPNEPRLLAGLLADAPELRAAIGEVPSARAASARIALSDPAGYPALVVFCHGSEDDNEAESPLHGPDRQPWVLPTDNGLPPLVILVACGTDRGNLVRFARGLLGHGARTVIAPFGRLDAVGARHFLEVYLSAWLSGANAYEALRTAQIADQTLWGARRLVIVGDGRLRLENGPSTPLDSRSTSDLAQLCLRETTESRDALCVLVDRLTLQACCKGGLDGAEDALRHHLDIPKDSADRQRWLFHFIESAVAADRIGRLTKAWLYPMQAHGAESWDHARLAHYERARAELQEVADLAPAIVYHYWNRVAYRRGRYGLALEEVLRGLQRLPGEAMASQQAPLLRSLANLFIEFDLPAASLSVTTRLQDMLGGMAPGPWVNGELHRVRDTLGRAHLRFGQDDWQCAMMSFEGKHEDAIHLFRENGHRELAWLLYIGAWADPVSQQTLEVSEQVRSLLQDAALNAAGHDQVLDYVYLWRAFAAWVWRTRSTTDLALVLSSGVVETLRAKLRERVDAGPIGFTLGFLHLACRDRDDSALSGLWRAARTRLLDQRYFLETAGFDALMGHQADARDSLRRHDDQRQEFAEVLRHRAAVIDCLKTTGLGAAMAQQWHQELAQRRGLEQQTLTNAAAPSAERLLETGLFPL